MVLVRHARAPRVDVALDPLHVLQIVVDNRSTFSRRDQFARLEAERSQASHRAAPPSPGGIGLLDGKPNPPRSPIEPAPLPFPFPPCACAQSSITFKSCFA